jgi:TonB family protein
MLLLLAYWWFIAAAGAFELPFETAQGPPPQLPALTRYEPPTFPESLRLSSIADGYATMLFTIDDEGRVEDSVALDASHPAFAATMRETFAKWRFEPAESATRPRRELIQFDFRRTGTVSSLSQRDASKAAFPHEPAESEKPIRTVDWSDLPTPPARIAGAMPQYPPELQARGARGFARISFVVDQAGAVRVPVIVEASDPAFGTVALAAVKQWRFAPPRSGTDEVNVRVERSFNFGVPPPK